jgi:endonuclease I
MSVLLILLACNPSDRQVSDSGADTGLPVADTEEPCEELSEVVETCLDLVRPGEFSGGDYYAGIDSESETLLDDLHLLIDDHEHRSFDSLWTVFPSIDARDDGLVWDIYSDIPGEEPAYLYEFTEDKCGQYQGEGDCYNREHVWPSSWFDDKSPMNSDLFHVFPTDGYVNNMRSSWPFGNVGEPNWESSNGSVRGKSIQCGFQGTVFEPRDEYKGDVARAFFYMSTRYRGEDEAWGTSNATSGARLQGWSEELLVSWHILDPVDDKERDRNQAVFEIQGNRNPFIDHPEWVCADVDF